jgi:hypothetical protein
VQKGGRAPASEHGLTRPPERRPHVGTFAPLKENNQDQCHTDGNMYQYKNKLHFSTFFLGAAAPCNILKNSYYAKIAVLQQKIMRSGRRSGRNHRF